MDYEQFKQEFSDAVKKELHGKGHEDINTSFHKINKTNESYEALTFTPKESVVGVNINMDRFYNAYENGTDMNELVNGAVDMVNHGFEQATMMDVSGITDYETMKDKLVMEVVSTEANADLLDKVPHKDMEDMSVVYRFVVEDQKDGRASILITNNLLNQYDITADQLHVDALENAPEIKPAIIQGMREVMMEMMGPEAIELGIIGVMDPADEMMFVASTPDKIQGASVIAYRDFMDQAAEKLGGNFYILPSSIHEILLVRDDGQTNADVLREMVMEVNETQVSPEEKLTDSVYHYDSKEHVFELAEKFEARQKNMDETSKDKSDEKGSVLKDLKEKQKDISEKAPVKDAVEKVTKSKGGEAI